MRHILSENVPRVLSPATITTVLANIELHFIVERKVDSEYDLKYVQNFSSDRLNCFANSPSPTGENGANRICNSTGTTTSDVI